MSETPRQPANETHRRPVGSPSARCGAIVVAMALGLSLLGAGPASADLKLCNNTSGRIGVAIGYQSGKGWATEGWWNVAAQSCETLLKGRLASRFFYVHAVDYDRGGDWSGETTMCTADDAFTIVGNTECEKRGHKSAGFLEVDTNDSRDWTIRLADPVEAPREK